MLTQGGGMPLHGCRSPIEPGSRPRLPDSTCNRVIVLNSRQHFTQTMHDLCQIIEAETGAAVRLTLKEELAKSLGTARPEALPASAQ